MFGATSLNSWSDKICQLAAMDWCINNNKRESGASNGMGKQANSVRRRKQIRKDARHSVFQQKAGQFCQTSTLHGVGDWYRAETIQVKIFWTVFFLGAFSAAVYGCYAILDQYLEAPVVVSYFVVQPEGNMTIPDVVVCPFNRFDRNFFDKHSIDEDLASYMEFSFGTGFKHPLQFKANNKTLQWLNKSGSYEPYERKLNVTLMRLNMTFNQFLDESSIPCEEFLKHCSDKATCCTGESVMTSSGKCYRVRGINQPSSGYPFAMSIVITLPKNRYHFSSNNIIGDGVAIKLAESGKGVDFDLTFIPVGTHAVMPLKATRYEFMNDPPRYVCSNDKEDSYSHMACLDACLYEVGHNNCGCSLPGSSFPTNLPSCTTAKLLCVFTEVFKDAYTVFAKCRRQCVPRCNYYQYAAALSYTLFPSAAAENLTNSPEEWEQMKNSIILDVYFERFETTVIKHYPAMTVHSFIANIGGQYSLWLGGSILTLIQIFVFLAQYLFHQCYSRLRKTDDDVDDERRNSKNSCAAPVVARLARESSVSSGWDLDDKKRKSDVKNPCLAKSPQLDRRSPCREFLF